MKIMRTWKNLLLKTKTYLHIINSIAMKKKTLYLLMLIFSISLFSAAKKIKVICDKQAAYCQLTKKGYRAIKEIKAVSEDELTLPSLGLFFIQ